MQRLEFKCYRCGKCCRGEDWLKRLIRASDIERWEKEERTDILQYICKCRRLIEPETHEPWTTQECPFLLTDGEMTKCTIYETRPEVCREFPIRICNNDACPEKYHVHNWAWRGSCKAAIEFRRDLVRTVEDLIVFETIPPIQENNPEDSISHLDHISEREVTSEEQQI